jgi:AcrR family transcriptional regulator
MVETDSLRTAMVEAAERQLAASEDYDIATRAVCEAVGVTQPVLYRLFKDKRGLLDAVADHGYERYAARKAAQARTGDSVADLLAGWDGHMDFARDNPALYQLMFAPRPWSHSTARERVFDLLVASLVRCAATGALRMEPREAAELVLAANVGIAFDHIAEPGRFRDRGLSHRMRDAVFATVLADGAAQGADDPVRAAALRLRAQVELSGVAPLEAVEGALLVRWLERLAGA